jgi:hypothetical protein
MAVQHQRRFLGGMILAAKLFGALLIAAAILELPAMRSFTGRYADLFVSIGAVLLLLLGAAWLFTVGMLIRFFDDYLSRN